LPELAHGDTPTTCVASDDVLCVWEGGEMGIVYYFGQDDSWNEKTGADSYSEVDCAPTHWMPLPSPPSAEKEER
jgi:hypothetical protein